MHSTMLVELVSSGKIVWPICYLTERLSVLLLPTKYVPTQESPCKLPNFRVDWHYVLRWGEDFWSERHRVVRFAHWMNFLLRVIFHHRSITSSPETCISKQEKLFSWNWVVSMPFHMHHWVLYLQKQRWLLVLMLCWLVLQLWAFCMKS